MVSARSWDWCSHGSGSGGGTRIDCGELREHSSGGRQRVYLRGLGEAGDTGWRRRLVLCGGGGGGWCCAGVAAAGMDDVDEQVTRTRTALNFTDAWKTFSRHVNRAKFSLWLRGAY
jgi:hypothetical protein